MSSEAKVDHLQRNKTWISTDNNHECVRDKNQKEKKKEVMDLQENMYEFARRQLKYSLKGRLYIYEKTFPNLQEKKRKQTHSWLLTSAVSCKDCRKLTPSMCRMVSLV